MKENVRVGVGVFVIKNDKFLIQKRIGAHGAGTWAPPGGHMEFGETWEQTAAREVYEETGLNVKNCQFVGLTNDLFANEAGGGRHYITIWTMCNYAGGEPKITEPDKCVGQRWVDIDNLPEPLFLPMKNMLKSEFIEVIKQRLVRSTVGRMKGRRTCRTEAGLKTICR